jgi:HrpA-like RNA helicase
VCVCVCVCVCVVLQAAVKEFASLGALCESLEELQLGRVLAKLPVDARLGKLLILGLCFCATDECLIIAAALATSRSPFLSPIDSRALLTRHPLLTAARLCTHTHTHMHMHTYTHPPTHGGRGW